MSDPIPSLLDHLHDEYVALIDRAIAIEGGQIELIGVKTSLKGFLAFAQQYLDTNRVIQHFPADQNLGIRLSNLQTCLISSPTEAGSGDMQDSGAIDIFEPKSQPGHDGILPSGSIDVI